jgi:hypothetical protein
MMIVDPAKTKARIWLPENDNVDLDKKIPAKIFLNINPSSGIAARIIYISDYTMVNPKGIPCFIAEADWAEKTANGDGAPQNCKNGLKGSAILFGQEVTLGYWIIRKPWAACRRFFGF